MLDLRADTWKRKQKNEKKKKKKQEKKRKAPCQNTVVNPADDLWGITNLFIILTKGEVRDMKAEYNLSSRRLTRTWTCKMEIARDYILISVCRKKIETLKRYRLLMVIKIHK